MSRELKKVQTARYHKPFINTVKSNNYSSSGDIFDDALNHYEQTNKSQNIDESKDKNQSTDVKNVSKKEKIKEVEKPNKKQKKKQITKTKTNDENDEYGDYESEYDYYNGFKKTNTKWDNY